MKATVHLEFAFQRPVERLREDCGQKLIAFHGKGGKPKRDRERKKSSLAWHSQRPLGLERGTAPGSPGPHLWTPEDVAHEMRMVA